MNTSTGAKDNIDLSSPTGGQGAVSPNKKVYFLSDFHLGVPDAAISLHREKTIVRFLDSIKATAHSIFIVGDMFDFWFEYRQVVPKGYVRLLGKLAELTDNGIAIHFFVGNHDMWMKNYFQKELNIPVYFGPQTFTFNNTSFYIAHGDGLGPGDHGYKALKKLFRSPLSQWLFSLLPPAVGMGLAHYFSRKSRGGQHHEEETFLGEDKEWLLIYSRQLLAKQHYNFFIYGHRHLPIDYDLTPGPAHPDLPGGKATGPQPLPVSDSAFHANSPQSEAQAPSPRGEGWDEAAPHANNAAKHTNPLQSGPGAADLLSTGGAGGAPSRYINLGEWMNFCTYAVFNGEELTLKSFTGMDAKIVVRK